MPHFLIELSHEDEHRACVKALDAIDRYGSHFMTHASWGCAAGVHAGYLIAELPSKDEALLMIPPQFRNEVKIVEVEHFTRDHIQKLITDLEK